MKHWTPERKFDVTAIAVGVLVVLLAVLAVVVTHRESRDARQACERRTSCPPGTRPRFAYILYAGPLCTCSPTE